MAFGFRRRNKSSSGNSGNSNFLKKNGIGENEIKKLGTEDKSVFKDIIKNHPNMAFRAFTLFVYQTKFYENTPLDSLLTSLIVELNLSESDVTAIANETKNLYEDLGLI